MGKETEVSSVDHPGRFAGFEKTIAGKEPD